MCIRDREGPGDEANLVIIILGHEGNNREISCSVISKFKVIWGLVKLRSFSKILVGTGEIVCSFLKCILGGKSVTINIAWVIIWTRVTQHSVGIPKYYLDLTN